MAHSAASWRVFKLPTFKIMCDPSQERNPGAKRLKRHHPLARTPHQDGSRAWRSSACTSPFPLAGQNSTVQLCTSPGAVAMPRTQPWHQAGTAAAGSCRVREIQGCTHLNIPLLKYTHGSCPEGNYSKPQLKSLSGLKCSHELVALLYKIHVSKVSSTVQKELCWALLQAWNKSLFSPNTALNPTGHRSFNIDPNGAEKHWCFWESSMTHSCWK